MKALGNNGLFIACYSSFLNLYLERLLKAILSTKSKGSLYSQYKFIYTVSVNKFIVSYASRTCTLATDCWIVLRAINPVRDIYWRLRSLSTNFAACKV